MNWFDKEKNSGIISGVLVASIIGIFAIIIDSNIGFSLG